MPIEQDFTVIQGDPWTIGLPCFNGLTQAPQSLVGYGAYFSLRANFGDSSPLLYFTDTTPTPNGSSISIQPYTGTPGTGTVCVVTPSVRGADTLAMGSAINIGAKTTRLWGQVGLIPPLGVDPFAVLVFAWYLRSKA